MTRAVLGFFVVVAGLSLSTGCGDPNSCQNATSAMEDSIKAVCHEAAFAKTPFCTCCVPAGMFSIDDTCTCKPLVFDGDFCYYKVGAGGYPAVRAALQYATSVCLSRTVSVPYGAVDGGMCISTTTRTGTGDSGVTGDSGGTDGSISD